MDQIKRKFYLNENLHFKWLQFNDDQVNGKTHTQTLISKYQKNLLFKFPFDKEQPSQDQLNGKTHTQTSSTKNILHLNAHQMKNKHIQ